MIDCSDFYNLLKSNGVRFFSGVPDSMLKNFISYLNVNCDKQNHIVAANEGNALAIAMGNQMASGNLPMVYLQNSGLGNLINPLISLADKRVYSIPCLLLIGWRGAPDIKDEPQHVAQGQITKELLEILGVDAYVLSPNTSRVELEKMVRSVCNDCLSSGTTKAILVKQNTFKKYAVSKDFHYADLLTREGALSNILDQLSGEEIIVSTTGVLSRELNELRQKTAKTSGIDFLTIGGMGHANQIALGIAFEKSTRTVICLDGDGAALMHLGSLAAVANYGLKNFKHIIFNNGVHDSVGGQSLCAPNIDYMKLGKALGYKYSGVAATATEIVEQFLKLKKIEGTGLLEILVKPGYKKDVSRPNKSPKDNKLSFIRHLHGS